MILVHDPDLKVLDLAAEGVAQDDQLDQRHEHRDHDQGGTAPKAAQVALDDGQDAVHLRSYMKAEL